MKKGYMALAMVLIISVAELSAFYLFRMMETDQGNQGSTSKDSYFGVTYGGNTINEAKLLVDRVKKYTNLFVIDSTPISRNRTALTELSDYIVNSGLHLMVYFDHIDPRGAWILEWLKNAKEDWGDKLVGIYLFDEPGGKQLEYGNWAGDWATPLNAATYSEAATWYVANVSASMWGLDTLKRFEIPVFTADYGLYWFDYLAGYDCVFAEFGWNHSRPLHVGMVRGAAKIQQKQWGVIITWEYNGPPYIENGLRLLEDMMYAHDAGAEYILVFNYPQNASQYGILRDEHFNVMEEFWSHMQSESRTTPNSVEVDTALVLPSDYGWAMMSPNDRIWGVFPCDATAKQVWEAIILTLVNQKLNIDIVYDDPGFNLREEYSHIYFCVD